MGHMTMRDSTKRSNKELADTRLQIDDKVVEFDQMSLMEKLRRHYYNEELDDNTISGSKIVTTYFFFYVSFSLCYVVLRYLIPFYYAAYSDWAIYCHKVIFSFIFVNAIANWLCVRCYTSELQWTADQPETEKSFRVQINSNAAMCANGDDAKILLSQNGGIGWCKKCQHAMPFRTHHCKACKRCVLKRDHHCYFTGVCIGYYNQRYFFFMSLYCAIGCFYGFLLVVHYIRETFWPTASGWDFLLPITIWKWWMGQVEHQYVIAVSHLYTLWWIGFMAAGYFSWQLYVIAIGKTSHEALKNIRVSGLPNNLTENFRSVFGPFWATNFILPMQLLFRQLGDGKNWFEFKHA